MDNKYIKFYNNLVNLTRNRNLYLDFTSEDTFSDRLIILLFHFAFFLNVFKSDNNKKELQEVFDYFFKQIEFNLRETGFGDVSINKKMKNYINIFFSIIKHIDNWQILSKKEQSKIFVDFLNLKKNTVKLPEYFENFRIYLTNNTFNSLLKGVIKLKF